MPLIGSFRERMWPTFSACRRKWVNEHQIIVEFQRGKSVMAPRAGAKHLVKYWKHCAIFMLAP
jgi:hypothetical protein